MKGRGLFFVLSTFLLFFTTFSTALSWPELFEDEINGLLLPRAEDSSTASEAASTSAAESSSSSAAAESSAAETSNTKDSAATTDSASASASASASGTAAVTTGSVKSSSRATSTSGNRTTTVVDPRDAPGGVSMLTPAATAASTYIKVGDQVTFKWNYTSLQISPSYIDIVASCSINSQTYTIAANQTFAPTQTVTWDTGNQPSTLPFVVATYTLMIYDADTEPTAVASAGHLNAFSNLRFGIYTPQPYTPLNEFRCATCSGALSLQTQAFSVLLGTCLLTVLSFTWFATGFGAFS